MKNQISVLAGAALFSSFLAMQPVSAFAATKDTKFTTTIELSGEILSKPMGIVHNGTTYVPIWYVKTALEHLGVQSVWNGTNHTWKMTLPEWMPTDTSDIKVGTGVDGIYLNNKLVKRVNTISAVDPSSKQKTAFMPIWYIQQLLNDITVGYNAGDDWDGSTHTWDMEPFNNITDAKPSDIVYLVDYMDTDIDGTSQQPDYDNDPFYIDQGLYAAGFYTADGFQAVESHDSQLNWPQYSTENNIKELSVDDNSFSTSVVSSTATQTVLDQKETDIVDYNDGSVKTVTQDNTWTLDKDPTTGLWQIDSIVPNGTTGSSSSANSTDPSNSTDSSNATPPTDNTDSNDTTTP